MGGAMNNTPLLQIVRILLLLTYQLLNVSFLQSVIFLMINYPIRKYLKISMNIKIKIKALLILSRKINFAGYQNILI